MNPFVLALLAYLLGSIPSSRVMARWGYGVDLTKRGSGNLGATNVFRVLGWKAAAPVVVIDVGKGWLPAWLFPQLDSSTAWSLALAYGAAAILGHVFSVWTGFRGGKGVATSAGVFLEVAPLALLVGLVVWLLLAFATRIVSVASMSAALSVAGVAWFRPAVDDGGGALRFFAVGLATFVLWSHRGNIGRLIRGRENRFGEGSAESGAGEATTGEGPGGSGDGSEMNLHG